MKYQGFSLLALGGAAYAAPSPQLAPMAFLAGHCWQGTFADGKAVDTHCFEWVYDGQYLRDRHVVKAAGRPDYMGETMYYWDPALKQIAYLYVENFGGIGKGTAMAAGDKLVFPDGQFSSAKATLSYRAEWTRVGDSAYEAVNETLRDGKWHTEFRMKLLKQP